MPPEHTDRSHWSVRLVCMIKRHIRPRMLRWEGIQMGANLSPSKMGRNSATGRLYYHTRKQVGSGVSEIQGALLMSRFRYNGVVSRGGVPGPTSLNK